MTFRNLPVLLVLLLFLAIKLMQTSSNPQGEFKLSISGNKAFGVIPGTSGNSNTVFVKCSCAFVSVDTQ